jgi:hypothetical protein
MWIEVSIMIELFTIDICQTFLRSLIITIVVIEAENPPCLGKSAWRGPAHHCRDQ